MTIVGGFMSDSTHWVYVMQLEDGKRYIGRTDDLVSRYQEHVNDGDSNP